MKVKLIASTPNMLDVIYTGARTCYNSGSPIDMWFDVCNIPTDKKINLLDRVLGSGHRSCMEHCSIVVAVEGVSRALLAQLSRHRFVQLSVQSQRYVEIKESLEYLQQLKKAGEVSAIAGVVEKYFVPNKDGMSGLKYAELDCLIEYRRLIEEEHFKPEDARAILPNSTKTNMIISTNIRELSHICNLRLCSRSQLEIRQMVKKIRDLVVEKEPWLNKYLQPSCEENGICFEHKSCGRKPTLEQVIDNNGEQ